MTKFMTVQELADLWEVTPRRIQVLCSQGKLAGATHFGKAWAIPSDVEKPVDRRIKSGLYIKDKSFTLLA